MNISATKLARQIARSMKQTIPLSLLAASDRLVLVRQSQSVEFRRRSSGSGRKGFLEVGSFTRSPTHTSVLEAGLVF